MPVRARFGFECVITHFFARMSDSPYLVRGRLSILSSGLFTPESSFRVTCVSSKGYQGDKKTWNFDEDVNFVHVGLNEPLTSGAKFR